jgi:CNT family concentrative nucleoside transporter
MTSRLIGLLGLTTLLAICYGLSRDRKNIPWRLVCIGIGLQVLLALVVLKTSAGRAFFDVTNECFERVMDFSREGSSFLFGALTSQTVTVEGGNAGGGLVRIGATFAFTVLPSVVFFSALMAVGYHVGIMERVVYYMAKVMKVTLGTSGAESLSAAANIFVGQTEAPLLVRPYLAKMTRSELLAIMVGGMANIAGGVMAAYVSMLSGAFPGIAGHLMAASIMSAPASLVFAKMLLPEMEQPETSGSMDMIAEKPDANVIDAATRGASEGLTLALNIAAMLIAGIGLVAMGNALWGWLCHGVTAVTSVDLSQVDTLQELLGYCFAPFAWLMGISSEDCIVAGKLLGEKTILNEFIAYVHLGDYLNGKPLMDGAAVHELSERTKIILSYALCGFANIGSIGILVGGTGALVPSRRGDVAKLGVLALIGGTFSTFMTATIAGMIL